MGELFELWGLLCKALVPTQRHQFEAALITKLEEWRTVGGDRDLVFATFAEAVLRDAFGQDGWNSLAIEDREHLRLGAADGLLLDALQFFQHVVKGECPHD